MQPVAHLSAELLHAVGEQDQGNRRWKGETQPRQEAADKAGAPDAYRYSKLAASRAGQELAERDELSEGLFIEPPPPGYVLISKVAYVGYGAAEGRNPQTGCNQQDFQQFTH